MDRHDLWKLIMAGKPRLHATGFAQMYIAPDVRLHVWSEELFKHAPDVKQIGFFHDHRYRIESTVLRGALLDTPAEMTNGTEFALYEVRPAHEGEPDKPHYAGQLCGVRLGLPRVVASGDTYEIPKRSFHATRALMPTITVMRKHEEEDTWARLLAPNSPRGEFDPVHSLIRQPDEKDIKFMMWQQLVQLDDSDRAKIVRMLK